MGSHRSRSRSRSRRWWSLLLLIVIVGVLLTAAAPAYAVPPPTLGLTGLQAELTAHGTVDGIMKTSMSGTSVSTIPVKVLAIVDSFTWGKLIMFECTDSAITDIGGIAAGMSGSPIYVNVNGTDRLIGAVSYGDWFTLRGTGLATPIQYMTELQTKGGNSSAGAGSSPGSPQGSSPVRSTVRLDEPVLTSAGPVRTLVLGDAKAGRTADRATAVMHPLAVARISGAAAGSTAYEKLAARLEDNGIMVLPGEVTAGAAATPALQPGSPCGVSFSTGHYAMYVLGTVTYVDGDDVLMFGHPILYGYSEYNLGLGPIQGTLVGATVDAIWPTTMEPYKMMTPADAKGIARQDRPAGVLAKLGGAAASFPIATHANVDGGATVTDVTNLGQWFATAYSPETTDSWGEGSSAGATTYVAAAGLYHGLDGDPLQGSATTKTSIVVNDGSRDYRFTRENIWDNSSDSWTGLADAAAGDVATIMAKVLNDPFGVRNVTVKSVDVTADFSSSRRMAGITDVSLARAIRAGSNLIDITYYRHGSADPQTMTATLDVPAGTDLYGYVVVAPAPEWGYFSDYEDYFSDGDIEAPTSLADVQTAIQALPSNGDVKVAYIPCSEPSDDEEESDDGPTPAAETTINGDRVFSGGVEKETARVIASSKGRVRLGEPIRVGGIVPGARKKTRVSIYCQEAGQPEPTEPTLVIPVVKTHGVGFFASMLPGFRHNVLITAEVGALSADTLPGADQLTVKVRARTRLTVVRQNGTLALAARVVPGDATGNVAFQRRVHGRWRNAGRVTVTHGMARLKIPAFGVGAVRARFAGGSTNAASAWVVRTLD